MNDGFKRRKRMGTDTEGAGLGLIVLIVVGILMLPIAGIYLLTEGENDTQKAIGLIIVVICLIGMIFGWL